MEKPYLRNCPICDNIIGYKRKDVLKSAISNNTVCSKCAKKKRKSTFNKYLDNKIIENVLSIYYDEKKTLKQIANECQIKFDTLKKIIETNSLPKIKRISKPINRDISYKKMFKTKFGLEYDEYLDGKPDFERYRGRVKYYTNKTIKKFKHSIPNINKIGRNSTDYHVDHIVSIKDCYLHKIDPKIVSDIINLRCIPRYENLSKGPRSLFSPEILLNNVTERIRNRIKISELFNIWNSQ